jgi:hypothetical protein
MRIGRTPSRWPGGHPAWAPFALGEWAALHRVADRVPRYRGLDETSLGRGRGERPVEHERAGRLHLLVELGPGLEVRLAAARRVGIGPHQHQETHTPTLSRRSDIHRGRSLRQRTPPAAAEASPRATSTP